MKKTILIFSLIYFLSGFTLYSNELPKGAKIKKIEFSSSSLNLWSGEKKYYEIEGTVQKDTFVVNQPITISYYNKPRYKPLAEAIPLISGILRKIDGRLFIEGDCNLYLPSERFSLDEWPRHGNKTTYYSKGLYGIESICKDKLIRTYLPAKNIENIYVMPSVEVYNIENNNDKVLQHVINSEEMEYRKYGVEIIVPNLKLKNNGYKIHTEITDYPLFLYDPSDMLKAFSNSYDALIGDSRNYNKYKWEIEFSNGDTYLVDGNKSEYVFANGDVVKGRNGSSSPFRYLIEENKFYWPAFHHHDIEIVFNSGESINEAEWYEVLKDFPSDIRDEMQREYRYPSEYKIGIEKIIEEQNQLIAQRNAEYQEKVETMKAKAKNWGALGIEVSKGNIKIGMTKEMVNTALMINGYNRSRNTNSFWGGSADKGLTTDPNKYTLDRLYEKVYQDNNKETYILTQMGQFIFGSDNGKLTFTNNKLTSISKIPNRGFY